MALTVSRMNPYTGTSQSTYVRVTSVSLNYATDVAQITVWVYNSSTARQNNAAPLLSESYAAVNITNMDAPFNTYFGVTALDAVDVNPVSNAYEYLKTLDQFDGATDA